MSSVLLLLTEPMTSPLAWYSVELAKSLLQQGAQVKLFFYQDAASIANRLNWRPSDEPNLAQLWHQLDLDCAVCVSAALLRGVTDKDNATRHQLEGENIAEGFRLVGLGDLADSMLQVDRVIHL
ncbi:sulfurtransferase complex subunit TusD [Aquirhabdus parva]|uniref:Sulfurtransferase complex subunit TusD n=1 Tax=Aquirhabdus parva TaxID=2283318 RepID=A0A345P622_9GAMM|nr:sulfurtransferase complex subunit TusD [Aquirhabdus parva]AXI02731.1 sulfurtransferase complex subunit TusD [Aquirhabdus parva]